MTQHRQLDYNAAGPFQRLVRRTAGLRPMIWLYLRIQRPVDRFVYRVTGGRTTASSWVSGLRVAVLTTTGAKTGQRRTLHVLVIPDGDALVVIASNYGGRRHPAWSHNLRAHPEATVTLGRVTREVTARELTGPEREAYYQRGIELYPPFVAYRRRASDRRIPVFRLETRYPLERPGRSSSVG